MRKAIVPCFRRQARVRALDRIDDLGNAESPLQVDKKKPCEVDICTKFIIPALVQTGWPLVEQHRFVARVEELRQVCAQLRERLTEARRTQTRLADGLVAETG